MWPCAPCQPQPSLLGPDWQMGCYLFLPGWTCPPEPRAYLMGVLSSIPSLCAFGSSFLRKQKLKSLL